MEYKESTPDHDQPSSGRESPQSAQNALNNSADRAPEENPDIDAKSQLAARNGVEKDMATVALDSALLKGAQIGSDRGRAAAGREAVDWSAMSDAEIMLRV